MGKFIRIKNIDSTSLNYRQASTFKSKKKASALNSWENARQKNNNLFSNSGISYPLLERSSGPVSKFLEWNMVMDKFQICARDVSLIHPLNNFVAFCIRLQKRIQVAPFHCQAHVLFLRTFFDLGLWLKSGFIPMVVVVTNAVLIFVSSKIGILHRIPIRVGRNAHKLTMCGNPLNI